MTLFLKNNVVFLHVPKTGGNFVTKVLAEEGLIDFSFSHKHADASHLLTPPFGRSVRHWLAYSKAVRRLRSADVRFFYAVRDPFSWYESWFKYQTGRGWPSWGQPTDLSRWHVNSELNACQANTFDGFLSNVILQVPGYVTRLYGRYRAVGEARVLRNETLAVDLCNTLEAFGLTHDRSRILQRERVGESKALTVEWPVSARQQIAVLDKAAFQQYGYE